MDLSGINVLAEFERSGISFEWATQEEIKICCPFHDDKTPSCAVNVKKRLFKCHTAGCNASGDIIGLLARYLTTTRAVVIADLGTRYTLNEDKLIAPALVEEYHARIWNAGVLLAELYKRGLTDSDIREHRIGEHEGRVIIPIKNESGDFVNLRKYLPGAPGKDKMRNAKGHGEIRIFDVAQLRYDKILLTGGECKAIVAARQLNPYGIGAICFTAGEGNFSPELLRKLAGKTVYVCLDIDNAGRLAAQTLALQLSRIVPWVSAPIVLPLSPDKYPKGDINDFIASEKGELLPLLQAAEEFKPAISVSYETTEEAIEASLTDATNAKSTGKRVSVGVVVSALDTTPYIIPKELKIVCDKSQKECALCPVFATGRDNYTIPQESPAILELIAAPSNQQLEIVKKTIGIPRACRVCSFDASSHYNIEDARVSPQLEITNRAIDRAMQPAYCIGNGLELNEHYKIQGRLFPNPKTQQATLLISGYHTAQDALSTYQCENMEELGAFWPREWHVDAIQEKLDEIYGDLEANVTRIYQRRKLHTAVDIAYHSPLFLSFDRKIVKGWVETLIVGDSAQGKSETTLSLKSHYGLGEKVECKNATVAGLLGGLQQMGTRWFVSWGVIPTHDRRLVILEELKGASTEVIARLTDMRSSGIAEIPKIEKRRTHARTRLIALSNPRSDMRLSQHNFGIEAIKELIGGLEDIRRFDFALLVGANEIDARQLNQLQTERPRVAHNYSAELCRKLILWSWTRTGEQVTFDATAEQMVLTEATALCEMFTDAIPLVDRGSMRLKLARIAASVAARLFSCDETYERIVVYPAHVEYASRYLQEVYTSEVFGYLDYSRAIQIANELIDPEAVKAAIGKTPFPNDLVKQLLAKNKVDLQDLQDWCAWDRQPATDLLSVFVRKHALLRDGRAYRKSAPFISLLRRLAETKEFPDRPEFLGEF